MNTGITLIEVRSEAMDAIRRLKSGEIDVKTATSVKGLLDTIVDTAKTQVEFLKSLPTGVKEQFNITEVKAIAGTLRDRDCELDLTMEEIERRNKQAYQK
jgi:putative heme iron utilization protein